MKEPKNGKDYNQAGEQNGTERYHTANPESFHENRLNETEASFPAYLHIAPRMRL
jgi:hypothetical protein